LMIFISIFFQMYRKITSLQSWISEPCLQQQASKKKDSLHYK
jgi:hypothetical protein